MSRTRALRLLGGAVVAAAVPGFATTKGVRAAPTFHTCEKDGGFLCQCPAGRGLFYKICCIPAAEYTCKCKGPPEGYAQCKLKPCEPCGPRCCRPSDFCANRSLGLCCRQGGESACGRRCCKPNEECVSLRVGTSTVRECDKKCPQGQVWCLKQCCPRGWSCAFGPGGGSLRCRRCSDDQVQCGKRCCPKQTPRCCGTACCAKTLSCCSGACADTKSDPRNCGSCGNVCESGVCSGGICALP